MLGISTSVVSVACAVCLASGATATLSQSDMNKIVHIEECVITTPEITEVITAMESDNDTLYKKTIEISSNTDVNNEADESESTEENQEEDQKIYYSEQDVIDIAKLLWGECRGVASITEQACVVWCVLNRSDKSGNSIYTIVREQNQFAFDESSPVSEDLYNLAEDVLSRWNDEKNGVEDSGRVLPAEYTYFYGDGEHNYFRDAFDGNYNIWDYSLESPYEN